MTKNSRTFDDPLVLEAALEGLELQKQRIESQIREIRSLLGRRGKAPAAEKANGATKKRNLSAEARRRIAAAQKKRWAEYRKSGGQK